MGGAPAAGTGTLTWAEWGDHFTAAFDKGADYLRRASAASETGRWEALRAATGEWAAWAGAELEWLDASPVVPCATHAAAAWHDALTIVGKIDAAVRSGDDALVASRVFELVDAHTKVHGEVVLKPCG